MIGNIVMQVIFCKYPFQGWPNVVNVHIKKADAAAFPNVVCRDQAETGRNQQKMRS